MKPLQSLIDKLSKTKTDEFINEELIYKYYEQVSKDIQLGIKEDGVWAKAFAIAEGDEQKAKAKYIELMVERLMRAHQAETEILETKRKAEALADRNAQRAKIDAQRAKIKASRRREQEASDKEFDEWMASPGGKFITLIAVVAGGFLGFFAAENISHSFDISNGFFSKMSFILVWFILFVLFAGFIMLIGLVITPIIKPLLIIAALGISVALVLLGPSSPSKPLVGCIEGNCQNRYGVKEWPDGSRYEGNFVNWSRHGKGVFTWANGYRYEGDWVDGKRHGKGVYTFGAGESYEGDWVDGKRHGKGVYCYSVLIGRRCASGIYENGRLVEDTSNCQGAVVGC